MSYEAGTAYISVLPSLKNFQKQTAAELKGIQAELIVPVKPELDPASKQKTERDGAAVGGAFADAFKARVRAAMRSLPKAEIAADSSEADLTIATIRAELEALSKQRVGIDIDEATALAKIAELQTALRVIGEDDTRISVQINTASARAALDDLQARIVESLSPDTAPEGDRAAGAFADAFKARLETAFKALPDIEIHAHSSDTDVILTEVRARLDSLKDKRVGIDIDETTALAQIAALEGALTSVQRQHPSVQVRVDAGAALAELAAIRAEVEALNHTEADVDVKVDDQGSTAQATSRIGLLRGALVGLAPAAIPITSTLIPGIAGIGLASISAVAGIAVLKLGLGGISEAFQAEQDASTQAAQNSAKNAQQIADAERSLQDARDQAADSAISSAERVASAEQSLADAERSAAEEVQNALQAQERAEQSLADAQRQALRAQQELNDARQSAARNLQDLQLAAIQADLDQRSATLQLAQAQQALASAQANPYAAPGQVAQAQLALDEAQLSAQRATVQRQRAGQDLSQAQQQGIEGAPNVVSAQDALISAQEGVGNAQQQVTNSAQALADAQISAAEKVANAQQNVTDAYREQASTARQSAEAIQSAQEAVANAENSNADAINKVNTALEKLSPAGREFVQFLEQVKPLFDSIGLAAQEALIPGIQAGIQALLPALPAIRDLVAQIAGGIGDLARGLGETLAGPFWQDFFHTVGQQIVPTLQTMGQVLGTFAEGAARLFVALLPLADAFGQAILKVAQRFDDWTKSPALAQFTDYLSQAMPIVGDLLGSVGQAALDLLPPLANLGLTIVKLVAPIVEKLLPPLVHLATVIADALASGLADATPGLVKLADAVGHFLDVVASDFGPVLGNLADLLGQIASVTAGVFAQAFHDLEPLIPPLAAAFDAIVQAGVDMLPAFTDLATKAIPPLLGLIPQFAPMVETIAQAFADIAKPLADVVATLVEALIPVIADLAPVAKPLLEAFAKLFDLEIKYAVVPILKDDLIPSMQATADVLKWLVEEVVDPMMKAYAAYSQGAYDAIGPVFDGLKSFMSDLSKAWSDGIAAIGEAWDDLEKLLGTPVKAAIDLVYNQGLVPMWNQTAFLIGGSSFPQLTKIKTDAIPHFAGGGVLPGYAPGRDVVPALLSPGEAILVPEVVRAIGPSTILAWNAAASTRPAGSIARFAGGGIVGDVLSLIPGLGDAAKRITDPSSVIKETGDSRWVNLIGALPALLIQKASDYLWSQLTSFGTSTVGGTASPATSGGAQLDQWIAAALTIAGVPASWASGLHTLIMRESGGNPRSINLTDINAQRGDPSRGLMQTIGATFEAYRDRRLPDDIYDPIANIVAGIHYIQARYGDISRVQQANPNLPPRGYDSGGWLPPGLTTVFNGTGKPEAVFTSEQFQSLSAAADPSGGEFVGELYLDSGQFLGMVRGQVAQSQSRTGTAIAQRSRI